MALFRKKRPASPQPVEFSFFDDRTWTDFEDEVRRSTERLRLDVERFDPGAIVVGGRMLGLLNVAQLCHASPRRDWPTTLDSHFETLTATLDGTDVLDVSQLRIRLVPDDYGPPEAIGDTMLARPFAESVRAVLGFDLATAVRMATADDLDDLGVSVDEAWSLAWDQTRQCERVDEHEVLDAGGARVHSLFGESFYVASLVPFLGDLLHDLGEHGALVSMPRRHTLFAHSIHDTSVIQAINAMIPLTRRLYSEGPGSVSAHLYWWRSGTLTWLPAQLDDSSMSFYPPDEFVDLLNSLTAPPG